MATQESSNEAAAAAAAQGKRNYPFTLRLLQQWGGMSTFRDGLALAQRGFVRNAKLEGDILSGTISWGSRSIISRARILPDHTCETMCPCRDSVERGIVCSHVVAVALTYLAKMSSPEAAHRAQEEERQANRVVEELQQKGFQRAPKGAAVDTRLRLSLRPGWKESARTGGPVPMRAELFRAEGRLPIGEVPQATPLALPQDDDAMLNALEELLVGQITEERFPTEFELSHDGFLQLLKVCGQCTLGDDEEDGADRIVETRNVSTFVEVKVSDTTGELAVSLRAVIPDPPPVEVVAPAAEAGGEVSATGSATAETAAAEAAAASVAAAMEALDEGKVPPQGEAAQEEAPPTEQPVAEEQPAEAPGAEQAKPETTSASEAASAGGDAPAVDASAANEASESDLAAGPTAASFAAPVAPVVEAPLPPQYFWTAQQRLGYVFTKGSFWPIPRLLPLPMREVYRHDITIPRAKVPTFLKKEFPTLRELTTVKTDGNVEAIDYVPGRPEFTLLVKGSPASLSFRLAAHYGDSPEFVAGREQRAELFAEPDPEDICRYLVRNLDAERVALARLGRFNITGAYGDQLSPVIGLREVRNFLGAAVPVLRRNGWKIEWEGRIAPIADAARFATPVVRVTPADNPEAGWFDVSFAYDDGSGASVSMADVARALNKGDAYIERHGKTLLLDTDAITMLQSVFEDCASRAGRAPGSFRLSDNYAAYAAGALRGLDGVDIEAPDNWLARFSDKTGQLVGTTRDEALPEALVPILRPYQKEGVRWLRVLEKNGFSGILADDMGLGKTLQTLVWFMMLLRDLDAANDHRPCLVVCPTSLVENWALEAAKFTPDLKTQVIAGPDRADALAAIPNCDVAITSYALLRRDIETYRPLHFAAVVLDEAQHIKNQTTQVSRATKQLTADHRLVLTGTPIENGVSDLWSIMDFLMPGYLGPHPQFRKTIEQPILDNTEEGELAQWRLRKKLAPFLLRRLKSDVAKELPPKIERVAYCSLTPDQKTIYMALLENSRRRLLELVKEQGFQRSRFEILQTLLRLRQCCCHTGLLKLAGLNPEAPSAKLELFHEILNEATEGGHRILLFSQFVTMLKILAADLDAQKMPYCYLDGSTQNRLQIVKNFNANPNIPVFLISLKAGGTGLNLTGADVVVHFDPWWNPAVENQATDRAYRIGQRRTVYSVKLITKDTVEERVLALQIRKQRLYDATLSDAATRLDDLSALTWEDVKEILSI